MCPQATIDNDPTCEFCMSSFSHFPRLSTRPSPSPPRSSHPHAHGCVEPHIWFLLLKRIPVEGSEERVGHDHIVVEVGAETSMNVPFQEPLDKQFPRERKGLTLGKYELLGLDRTEDPQRLVARVGCVPWLRLKGCAPVGHFVKKHTGGPNVNAVVVWVASAELGREVCVGAEEGRRASSSGHDLREAKVADLEIAITSNEKI
mmetsp:Transcript_42/g.145  ORF Transcript_42/g.145 Transcript_42/m.145 type:complete len:203 (-) Transcript_42:1654-2262(-)